MTDSVNERELVLGILLDVTAGKEYSHIALRNVLDKYQYLDKKKRAFITRMTEGTLENLIQIDYILNQFSKVRVNKMKPVIRGILRMGVYELKFMDSIPPSATCNEAVKLAERRGFRNLKGFVNGILRNISRNLETVEYPREDADPVLYLSVKYSMPEWIVRQWEKDYGMERTVEILEAFLVQAPITVRVNTTKITGEELEERFRTEGVSFVKSEELPYAYYLSDFDSFYDIPSFEEGLFSIQDLSSMMVAELAAPEPGDFVLDVCSAPGGKSIHLAEKLKGTGMVEARDLTEYKVDLINENIERLGVRNIRTKVWDARVLDESMSEKADIVIADLPCSGLGVLAKKTDIRYNMTPEKERELVLLQREILTVAGQYVKPGGVLLYSTCTIDVKENEENADWFLREFPEFTLEMKKQIFPEAGKKDGFFLAKFVKAGVYGEK